MHSDKQCSIVGYGVFRRCQMAIPFTNDQLAEHLEGHVPGGIHRKTDVLWAWYREVDEPLQDFSRQETLVEVEKIRRREKSEGDEAFRKTGEHHQEEPVT